MTDSLQWSTGVWSTSYMGTEVLVVLYIVHIILRANEYSEYPVLGMIYSTHCPVVDGATTPFSTNLDKEYLLQYTSTTVGF